MATKLPQQVQAQLAQADATLAAISQPPAPPAPTPPAEPPAAPPQPPVEPPAAPPPQPPAPAAAAPAAPSDSTWEQRYRTLQGLHHNQKQQIEALTRQVTELQTKVNTPPAPTPAPTAPPKPAVDPKDVEAFGLDMVTMVERTCERLLAGMAPQIETQVRTLQTQIDEIRELVQGTTQTVALTAEQTFFAELDRLVPTWTEINQMEGFLAWLAALDPIYGVPRQAALDAAQKKGDAKHAAKVFQAFIDTLPKPLASPPAESPTPRSSGGGQPPAPPAAPSFTQAQVEAFYRDVQRGVYRTQPQEAARIESEINAAMAEGRIR